MEGRWDDALGDLEKGLPPQKPSEVIFSGGDVGVRHELARRFYEKTGISSVAENGVLLKGYRVVVTHFVDKYELNC